MLGGIVNFAVLRGFVLFGVLTRQIWVLVSISLCGFNSPCQLVWMLHGKLFEFETVPLDPPQYIVCAPSVVSNYSLGGAFFSSFGCILSFIFIFWQSLETTEIPLFLLSFAVRITHWHIVHSSQRGWTTVEPSSTGEEANKNEKPLKRPVISFI